MRNRRSVLFSIAAAGMATMLAGCATTNVVDTAQIQIATPTPETVQAGQGVQVMAAVPAAAQPIGEISVTACQKTLYQPEPDNAYALALLKADAAAKGATVLAGVKYRRYNVSFTANCYTNIVATGIAAR